MSTEEREFLVEARRHLVGLVGLIERFTGVEPVCRRCAGCKICESMHKRQDQIAYTSRESSRSVDHVSTN